MRNLHRSSLFTILAPALTLLGLVVFFFNRLALTNLILARGDTFLYFYPYWHAAAGALREMRVPLWNPAIFMGAPLLANSQAGFFYPLNWPLWWFLETPYAVSVSIILHLLLAASGVYLAGRRLLDLSYSAALVAAASFALGGYLTAQVEHINQLQGLAWLPWFLVTITLPQSGSRRSWLLGTAATACLFALQLLAGHTQTAFITGVALLIWIIAGWIARRVASPAGGPPETGNSKPQLLSFTALASGVIVALILSAVQLLPTLELARHSSRQSGLPVNEVLSFSLPPQHLTRALLPSYGQSLFTEYVAFLPLAVLALACVGAWQWRKRPGAFQALALALTGLLLAFGAYNPLYWLLARLPGFNLFRAPARWLVLYALGLSLLAGLGWHLLWRWAAVGSQSERRALFRSRFLPPLALVMVIVLLLAAWGFAAGYTLTFLPLGSEAPFETPSAVTIAGWLLEAAAIVSLMLAAVFLTKTTAQRRALLLALLLAGLTGAFLASRALPYNNPTTPEAFFDLRPSTTRLLIDDSSPPGRLLSLSDTFFDPGDQAEIDSIYADQLPEQARYDYTVAIKQKEINAPNLPMLTDLASVDGFDGGILPLRAYSLLTSLLLADGAQTSDGRLREHLDAIPPAPWLDLFNARYVLTDKTGDVWIDGVYFDRQHPYVIAAGSSAEVTYLPQFEADEIRLLASARPQSVHVVTQDGRTWDVETAAAEDDLYVAALPEPAVLTALEVSSCELGAACTLHALSLFNSDSGAFQSLVTGAYRLIHSGDVKIYENSDVLPRAFMLSDWRPAADLSEASAAMSDASFDPRTSAVIEVDSSVDTLPDLAGSGADPGQARITAYAPERVEISAESPDGGLLVLTDAYYPGWQATLDGRPAAIHRADLLFRGVFVPPGRHEIVFHYESQAYRAGLILFILSCVILLCVLLWLIMASRRNP